MKHCQRCSKSKPISEFYKNKCAHDGVQSHCKAVLESAIAYLQVRVRLAA